MLAFDCLVGTVAYLLDPNVWEAIGWIGQGVFGARFFVQWLASEKAGKVVVPVFFWYLSIVGGLFSLAYAIHVGKGPFILGQAMGTFVYIRNLFLHMRKPKLGLPE